MRQGDGLRVMGGFSAPLDHVQSVSVFRQNRYNGACIEMARKRSKKAYYPPRKPKRHPKKKKK